MNKLAWFLSGFILAALAIAAAPVLATALPAPALRVYQLTPAPDNWIPTPAPTKPYTMQPAANPVTAVGQLGLTNQVQCFNCTPFQQRIRLTHYDPMAGPINCWDYDQDKQYCYSPTKPGIRWKGAWGFGAACPFDWPYGTWVVVPGVGAFVCLDRGGAITCDTETGICAVDVLGPAGQPWDGQIFDATLWVPLDPPRN